MKRVVPRFSGVRKIRLGRGLSLATRIILINIVAMVLMLAGLLYFGRYMDRFVTAEVSTLINQAGLIAGTLGEVAVENTEEGDTLETDTARQVIRRLVGTSDTRTRVFSPSSLLVADSRLLRGAGRYVEVEQLDPPDALSHPSLDIILGLFDNVAMFMPNHGDLPVFADTALPGIDQLPDVEAALHGENHWTLWTTEDSELVLTVAVPIQRVQQIVGAVMLSRDSRQLASAIRQMRTDMLKSFSIVLSMSILLSLYLAQTIARPLRRLARAATSTDVIAGSRPDIPDYARRGDEVGALSVALRGMTEALWQRLDAIERFAADVAHELKNPLTSMHSAIETLHKVRDDRQRNRLLEIVREDVRRMERLITDISAASRLEAEIARTIPEIFDMGDFAAALVANRAQTGSAITFTSDAGNHLVRGIPGRMAQVLENLIGNALSFSPLGKPVSVTVKLDKDRVVLTVEDEGRGIPLGKEEKIFERFYSERPEGEAFGTHSGLGLSICRQIVEGLGGRIGAGNRQTADGRVCGARFVVELPAIPDK